MDKYEYRLRAEEIDTLINNKQYEEAMGIADIIDWTRVKSVQMLTKISDLYKVNRRYDVSRDILMLAYERCPNSRSILYSLCELSIKLEDIVEAVTYYQEFVRQAPRDADKYVLQYRLYEAQDISLEERIEVLEELKEHERRERWCYELAYLYHRLGLATKCVEECDEIALWFGTGKFVNKALELKMLHEPLTKAQEDMYKNRNKTSGNVISGDTREFNVRDVNFAVKTFDAGNQFNTINLQKELAESMKDLLSEEDMLGMPTVFETMEDEEDVLEQEELVREATEELQKSAIRETVGGETEELISAVIAEFDEDIVKQGTPVPAARPDGNMQEIFFSDSNNELFNEVHSEENREDMIREEVEVGTVSEPFFETEDVPKKYADMLSQEYDGQISLVVPQDDRIEKQITGQLNIEEVLAEWERVKREHEEKRATGVKEFFRKQSGTVLSQFNTASTGDELAEMEAVADAELAKDNMAEQETVFEEQTLLRDMGPEELAQISILSGLQEADEESEEDSFEELTEVEVEEAAGAIEEYEAETDEVAEAVEEYEAEADEVVEAVEEYEAEADEVAEAVEEYEAEADEVVEAVEEYEAETEEVAEAVEEYEAEAEEVAEEYEAEATEEFVEEADEAYGEEEEVYEEQYLKEKKNKYYEQLSNTRKLTPEERELFGSIAELDSMNKQIARAVDDISLASFTGNVILTGEPGSGTMSLAKNLIKSVQLTDSNFSGKVARISGEALNKKDIGMTFSRLQNGAIIVEKAGGLVEDTLKQMNKYLDNENNGIIVVLEDTKKAMRRMLKRYSRIEEHFTTKIDIEEIDIKSLVKYGQKYAYELEYSIDEMGVLALYTRISNMQTGAHNVTLQEVRDIIDEAIWSVGRKTPKHFFDIIFGKRYDGEDMIVLREKDFIC